MSPLASVATVRLKRWSQIHKFASDNAWLFRGQERADWELRTSLERCCEKLTQGDRKHAHIERQLIREFKRAYHLHAQHPPTEAAAVEWLSLMQHHGAPTRLLDFTYSIYVAAYFALERANGDCAVWAINAPWLLYEAVNMYDRAGSRSARLLYNPTEVRTERIAHRLLFRSAPQKLAFSLSPFRQSERLRTQRGTFIVPGDVSFSYEENLAAVPGWRDAANFKKIIIPAKLRKRAMESLHAMNISRRSLFPGLDGFAQSLNIYHPSFGPSPYETYRVKRARRKK
jgi:hypothetical protein